MRLLLAVCLTLTLAPPVLARGTIENVSVPAADAVNSIRARHGRPALRTNPLLARAAAAHASDMVQRRFFSHTGSDGSTIGTRARDQDYRFCVISENIAKGHRNPQHVLRAWMNSRGHRRNLLNADVTEFALVRGSGDVWVMMLGDSGC